MPGGGGGCLPPMDLMRSEEMQLLQVIIPTESAHLAVSNLGDLGLIQFKDVSAPPVCSCRKIDLSCPIGFGGGSGWCRVNALVGVEGRRDNRRWVIESDI